MINLETRRHERVRQLGRAFQTVLPVWVVGLDGLEGLLGLSRSLDPSRLSSPFGSSGSKFWKGWFGSSGSPCHRARPGRQANPNRQAPLNRQARSGRRTRLDFRAR